jgi:Tol biopolymer transport system component
VTDPGARQFRPTGHRVIVKSWVDDPVNSNAALDTSLPEAPPPDAISTPDVISTPDAPPATDAPGPSPDVASAPPCNLSAPWGTPVPITELNSPQDDFSPWLSNDERTVYFSSTRDGPERIYVATRASVTAAWGAPALLPGIASGSATDGGPTLTDDGLTMYFQSSRASTSAANEWDIFRATRATTSAAFGNVTLLTTLSSSTLEINCFVLPGGDGLYFASSRNSSWDIFYTPIVNGVPGPVSVVIGTAADERSPLLTRDGLTMYFERSKDIVVATRATVNGAFGAATVVAELSSTGGEKPRWVSPDGCRFYLYSDRSSPTGMSDLYVAKRP